MSLTVTVDGVELDAAWTDDAPETRAALDAALPLAGEASRWGDELYFGTDVDVPAENARAEVDVGTVAYWPQGNAVCLFWGPTPASEGEEPRAASPVNVVASVADVSPLRDVAGGATVRLD
jgi:hypothetical protein